MTRVVPQPVQVTGPYEGPPLIGGLNQGPMVNHGTLSALRTKPDSSAAATADSFHSVIVSYWIAPFSRGLNTKRILVPRTPLFPNVLVFELFSGSWNNDTATPSALKIKSG